MRCTLKPAKPLFVCDGFVVQAYSFAHLKTSRNVLLSFQNIVIDCKNAYRHIAQDLVILAGAAGECIQDMPVRFAKAVLTVWQDYECRIL